MPIDWSNPVNRSHPLNRGLVSWHLVSPINFGGLTLRDIAGNNHGTLTLMDPATDWVRTSRRGGWGALDLDGLNDYLDTVKAFQFGTKNFGIGLWVKTTTTASRFILGTVDDGSNVIITLKFNADEIGVDTIGETWFSLRADGNVTENAAMTADIYDGEWHHVFIRRNGASTLMYVDGVSQTLTIGTTTLLTSSVVDTGYPIFFGAWNLRGVAGTFGAATLDDIRVWDRGLSATEVREVYENSKQGYPGLLNRRRIAFVVPVTGPVLSDPTQDPIGDTTVTVGCSTSDTTGTMYYYISTSGTAPSVPDLKDGTGATKFGNDVTVTNPQTFDVTGLTLDTEYFTYFVQNDGSEDSNLLESGSWMTTGGGVFQGVIGGGGYAIIGG